MLEWRTRIADQSGLLAEFFDRLNRTVRVRGRLGMDRDLVRASLGEHRQERFGIDHHQMHIDKQFR
jgi:hypothetical protein